MNGISHLHFVVIVLQVYSLNTFTILRWKNSIETVYSLSESVDSEDKLQFTKPP